MRIFPVIPLILMVRPLQGMTDDFDTDPLQNPAWELYQPAPGVTLTTENGFLRATIPAGIVLDHWLAADDSTQLRRSDMPDDFTIETRLRFVGSGDPANPIWLPVDESYLTCLMVYFSRYDVFYWGPHRGTNLALQRTGTAWLCNFDPGLQELSLQVKKIGTLYSFAWRESDADPWTVVCTQTAVEKPGYVGLMFKSWNPVLTLQETFDFDFFTVAEIPSEAPEIEAPCPFGSPDIAWVDQPYVREIEVKGHPTPEVVLVSGPPEMTYDPSSRLLLGWTPRSFGTVDVKIEASNALGKKELRWSIDVSGISLHHSDEFDVDPAGNAAFWELYEPQPGIAFSIDEPEPGSTWWRLQVPQAGTFGQNFDHWTGADRAPQLRHWIDPAADFLIETRVRIAPESAPIPGDEFLAGLMVYFGPYDLIHWNVGQQRTIGGLTTNLFMERAGINDILHGQVDGLLSGIPVKLRIERKCDLYSFFYRGEGAEEWTFAGSYKTETPPQAVGLIMKTWADGSTFTVDFDYFDMVKPGPRADFILTPSEGWDPLEVKADGSGSSSPGGAIVRYDWDFGDGAKGIGPVQTHLYPSRGTYEVTLTVTDASGDQGSRSAPIRVHFRSDDVAPWQSVDIGVPPPLADGGERMEGSCMRILAVGKNLNLASDQFHFVYQPLSGNASLVARFESARWPPSARVGVMVREDLTPGSRHGSMLLANYSPEGKFLFLRREGTGNATKPPIYSTETFLLPDAWVMIERRGGDVIGSFSEDGKAWTELGRAAVPLPENYFGGIAVVAMSLDKEVEALLCDLKVEGAGAGDTFRRGDVDANGSLEVTDPVNIINFLFLGPSTPPCLEAADTDDDGSIDVSDVITNLNYQFLSGAPPAPPGPNTCGPDPSPPDYGCDAECR